MSGLQFISSTGRKPSNSTGSVYRPDIDGLRGIAVLSVVLYHAFPNVLRGGFIGVDIFFVISGFLISGIIFQNLEGDKFSFFDFYARRIRRIFPSLLLVIAFCLALGWFVLLPNEYRQLGKHVAAGAGFVSNFALWGESGYFDVTAGQKPLLHLWSLGIEEQFYLLWPLLLWLAFRRKQHFFALTLAVALLSFSANAYLVASDPVAAFYSPLCRFWELMFGSFLAYLNFHNPNFFATRFNLLAWMGGCGILVTLLLLRETYAFPGWWALLPVVSTFVVLSAPTAWFNRYVLANRALVALGLISYPLYLWHWPLLYFNTVFNAPPSRYSRLAVVVISIIFSTLTYLFVEKPARRTRLTKNNASILLGALSICGVGGMIIFLGNGIAFRMPTQFAQFATEDPETLASDCFLKNRYDFPPACTNVTHRPAIFLWGDSHANSLFWGLEPLQDKGFASILQVTGPGCPPLLGYVSNLNSKCPEIYSYALKSIALTKPDVVVLHAIWGSDAYDLSKLDGTIQQISQIGIKHIILLGPVPRWNGTLLQSVFRCWHPQRASDTFPKYSNCGLDDHVVVVDELLHQTAKRLNVEYISAYQMLCTAQGCLTHVDDRLTTYDYGHLSKSGAEYLVSTIAEKLIGSISPQSSVQSQSARNTN